MSGVFKRFRGRTETQFEINALKIQSLLIKYAASEKFVPKKYRLLIGVPLVEKGCELVNNITYANSIKAENEADVQLRKKYQSRAIANCFQIQNLLVNLEMTVDKVTIKSLEEIITLLCDELPLLISWRKGDKIREVPQKTRTFNKPVFQ